MVRIAIISDIHFGIYSRSPSFSVPGQEIQDKCKEVHPLEEGLIELFCKMKPQYFFVAGDLTSIGNPQEFYFCEEKILSIAKKVGVANDNIFCVLGNHDIDWNISELGKKETENVNIEVKKLVARKYQLIAANSAAINLEKLVLKYDQDGPAPFSGVIERDEFIVFILNSGWCCTRDQEFPHGKLDLDQFQWFARTAKKYKNDGRKKIILMHHHPFNYAYPTPGVDISTIEEGAELMEIATENGIDIIIHGHRHHPHIRTIQTSSGNKPIAMLCAGSLSVNHEHRNKGEIPNTVHFLDLDSTKDYFVVHNFMFSDAYGWEAIKHSRRETPIDAVMKIGKIFSSDDIKIAIEKYLYCEEQQLCWSELEECLQFMPCEDLNEKFAEVLKPTHEIVSKFPDKIVLIKK